MATKKLFILFAAFTMLATVVCDDGSNPDDPICEPGAQQHCGCADGETGYQICQDDGDRWGACECPATDGDADGDTDSDGDGDGDSDGDSDTDGDADGDSDTDVDADGDSDADADGDADADAEIIEEECNGVDDDGDGEIDEDFDCSQGAEAECVTTCGTIGRGTCSDTCELPTSDACIPPPEICGNGIDDNCDGEIDPPAGVIGDPLVLIDETYHVGNPSIAWNGTDYAVVWEDDETTNTAIYFARFTDDGTMVTPPVLVSELTESASTPKIVWTGTDYGVAYRLYSGGVNEGFRFVKLSEVGAHLSIVEEFGNPSDFARPIEIAWSGHEFGVVWTDSVDGNDNINFMMFGSSGVRLGDSISIIELTGRIFVDWLSVEWTGTEFFVTWMDRSTGLDQGYAQTISSSGALSGGVIQVTNSPTDVSVYSVSSNGSGYGVVFSEPGPSIGNYYIYFAEINRDGDFLGAPLLLVDYTVKSPFMIRATVDGYFIAWRESLGAYEGGIGFAHLDSSATTAPPTQFFQPDSDGYPSTLSSVMTAEGHFALAYKISRRTTGNDIGFARVGGCW